MGKILICGATGRVGSALAPLLLGKGHTVFGLTRSLTLPAVLQQAGVIPVQGDLRDMNALAPKIGGYDSVFLATGDAPDQDRLEIGVIDAFVKTGNPHVVKLSAQSAGLVPPVSFGVQHRKTEQALQASGLPYTILRPTFFQQSILLMKDDIAQKSAITVPMGHGRAAMVDVRDIADVAAQCLTDPAHRQKTYMLTGPEAFGFAQVTEHLTHLLGRKVKYNSPPAPVARLVMPFLTGMPRWQTNLIIDLMRAIRNGAQETVTTDVERLTGHAPRPILDFLTENKSAFEV